MLDSQQQAAFPDQYKDGMTLRDYFAAKAMQGFLSSVKVDYSDDLIAVDAYSLADAMMEARLKILIYMKSNSI